MSLPVAPPLSKKRIIEYAEYIRQCINCKTIYIDIVAFIEFVIPKIDPSFVYEYVDDNELPRGVYAYYDPLLNIMKISASVYERAYAGEGRDRFTLAHEVGHYFLHRDGYSYARSNLDIPKYCDPEWQANTFASAFLIPQGRIKNMSINEIKNTCKVSYQAAEIAYNCNWQ